MTELDTIEEQTPFYRLVHGHYGLAVTYWALFLIPAAAFFYTGSIADRLSEVDEIMVYPGVFPGEGTDGGATQVRAVASAPSNWTE